MIKKLATILKYYHNKQLTSVWKSTENQLLFCQKTNETVGAVCGFREVRECALSNKLH